jgi:hypothetical protein
LVSGRMRSPNPAASTIAVCGTCAMRIIPSFAYYCHCRA